MCVKMFLRSILMQSTQNVCFIKNKPLSLMDVQVFAVDNCFRTEVGPQPTREVKKYVKIMSVGPRQY